METTQQLQDLVDRLSEEIPLPDIVNLHLPPVTYEGGLFIQSRPFNLYGSTDQQGHRTTFTDTVAIHAQNEPITYFYDLDFVGNGENIGLSSPSRLWAENCTFSNWKTGVMGYGSAWVNVIGCRFSPAIRWASTSTAPEALFPTPCLTTITLKKTLRLCCWKMSPPT